MKNQKQKRSRPLAFSKLTQRLLIINVVALAIIGGGVLFLDQTRHALTEKRLNDLQFDIQRIADDLKAEAIPLDPEEFSIPPDFEESYDAEPYEIDLVRAEQFLLEVARNTTYRLRLYDDWSMKPTLDTAAPIHPTLAIDVSELPPPKPIADNPAGLPPADNLNDKILRNTNELIAYLRLNLFSRTTNEGIGIEPKRCVPESIVSKDVNGNGVLNVAVGVSWINYTGLLSQGLRQGYGRTGILAQELTQGHTGQQPFKWCLLLTVSIAEIDKQVADNQKQLLWLSVIALSVTLLLSLYLARSIAHPVRQLAAAAENATKEPSAKHMIPDLSDRRDEIGDLSVALRQMGDSLSERITAIERFAGDVTHELKNPLASLSSTNELLERYGNDTDFRRHLARQADDINRMDRLISEILDDARLDSELANALTKKVELNKLLSTLTQVYNETGLIGKTRLDFKNEAETTSVVYGDEQQLARVIQNLVDNSIAFSPPDGLILIRLSHQEGNVRILVDDQGPGVPHDNLEKIFEPFVTHSPEGDKLRHHSGLGLSIAKKIVRRHSGTIWAENKYNVRGNLSGSRFIVQIPTAT